MTLNHRIDLITDQLVRDINTSRFIPYFQIHEFESLLFSEPEKLINLLKSLYKTNTRKLEQELRNPEEINFDLPPSKLIESVEPLYAKLRDGTLLMKKLNIQTIIDRCPYFKQWIDSIVSTCSNQN